MAAIIDLPKDRLNKIKLADWLEIVALLDSDYSSSIEDLTSLLKIECSDEKVEELRNDVSSELMSRYNKMLIAYPFFFNGKLLKVKNKRSFNHQWTYIFCLLVSYIGLEKGTSDLKVWKIQEISSLFEKLCTIAAKNYLSSEKMKAESLQFGAPRISWRPEYQPFKKALEYLKGKINEGNIKGNPTGYRRQDAGLDVIAWLPFPDNRTNKLFLYGQCAAGVDYRGKTREVHNFSQYYSLDANIIYSFFVPHEFDETEWFYFYDPTIGLLFDRSRVAFYAQEWEADEFKHRLPVIFKSLKSYGRAL